VLFRSIYDIQGFSVQDGPGIRTTVFLKGCPLHCPWCHSPESQRFDIQLSWQSRKCIGLALCGLCLDVCPREALGPAGTGDEAAAYPGAAPDSGGARGPGETAGGAAPRSAAAPDTGTASHVAPDTAPVAGTPAALAAGLRLIAVDWGRCDDCGLCVEACPAGALSLWGKEYTVTEVVERVLRDRPFFEKSGGGVTISGGEPFSQAGFTLALLRAFKAQGLHTAVDTTGCAPWEVVEKALPYIDLFLYDLKSLDAVAHKAATGVGNAPILDNARRIAVAGGKMQVRLPVVPRFNESEEHIRAAAEFIQELGDAVTTVQVLPYHAMGVPKLERIRHRGPILEATLLTDAQVERIKAILEEYGLLVQVH
jgi:pyruvate formate lyase activating enzyme